MTYPVIDLTGKKIAFMPMAEAKLDGSEQVLRMFMVTLLGDVAGDAIGAVVMTRQQLEQFSREGIEILD